MSKEKTLEIFFWLSDFYFFFFFEFPKKKKNVMLEITVLIEATLMKDPLYLVT